MPKRHKTDLIRIELICKNCEVTISNLYMGSQGNVASTALYADYTQLL